MSPRARVSVALSRTCKGKPRREPVWIMRYRLPSGKDSAKVLGPAWMKKGRPAAGYLTESEAHARAELFAGEHSTDTRDDRRTFAAGLDAFLAYCAQEKDLRGETIHGYRKIGERLATRPLREGSLWADRVLDTFSAEDLLVVRRELLDADRSAETINHYRRVIRGVFGTHVSSPALAWPWMAHKPESEGKLRFYTPEQVEQLLAVAYSDEDRAIYTLATEAGARVSEVRALKVEDIDFNVAVVRLEDGYTTHGGFAGNKGRRTRSVPMSANVAAVLRPFCQGKDGKDLVFQNPNKPGEPICASNLYRRFIKAAKRAGLPPITLHELRHTFGTQAIRVFKIHEVQRMMGHRHITTTERYLHYAADPEGSAKLTALWGERRATGRDGSLPSAESNVIALRKAA
jgi:integrase